MPSEFDVDQWARDMANLADATARVLNYEAAVLHKAVNQGIKDAGESFAAALDRAHNEGERSR